MMAARSVHLPVAEAHSLSPRWASGASTVLFTVKSMAWAGPAVRTRRAHTMVATRIRARVLFIRGASRGRDGTQGSCALYRNVSGFGRSPESPMLAFARAYSDRGIRGPAARVHLLRRKASNPARILTLGG